MIDGGPRGTEPAVARFTRGKLAIDPHRVVHTSHPAMLFSRFAVRLQGTRLSAEAWGEPVDAARHHPAVEVKGATYTSLRVAQKGDGWMAQTVVDI